MNSNRILGRVQKEEGYEEFWKKTKTEVEDESYTKDQDGIEIKHRARIMVIGNFNELVYSQIRYIMKRSHC